MRRKHTAAEYAGIVEYAVKKIPEIGLGTDVMVGYPGENDTAFINTKKLLADLPVSFYHVFTYSDRMGTASYKMNPKADHHVKKERMRVMIELGKRKKHAYFNQFLNSDVQVLFEDRKDRFWSGLTDTYIRVRVSADADLYNQMRTVRLRMIEEDSISGVLI
jgi:threonylcarbamoyladenosine tRNA methylthiotransferase MtaB